MHSSWVKSRPMKWLNSERGEEIAGNFDGYQLMGLSAAGEFVLDGVIKGLVSGYGLERLIVSLEFFIGIDGIGLPDNAASARVLAL